MKLMRAFTACAMAVLLVAAATSPSAAQDKIKTLLTEIQILRTQIPGIDGGGPEKL